MVKAVPIVINWLFNVRFSNGQIYNQAYTNFSAECARHLGPWEASHQFDLDIDCLYYNCRHFKKYTDQFVSVGLRPLDWVSPVPVIGLPIQWEDMRQIFKEYQ